MTRRLPLLVVALALAVSACSEAATDEVAEPDAAVEEVVAEAPADTGADTGADTAAPSTGDAAAPPVSEALWWSVETIDGEPFAAADLAGENVVLWMWAPWCSVCNREAPDVAAALADLPDDVTIVGVAGRDDVEPMRAFVEEHGLSGITHVVDADGDVWASYGISYQPAWVFIDEAGDASVAAGALGYDGIFDGIEQVFGS